LPDVAIERQQGSDPKPIAGHFLRKEPNMIRLLRTWTVFAATVAMAMAAPQTFGAGRALKSRSLGSQFNRPALGAATGVTGVSSGHSAAASRKLTMGNRTGLNANLGAKLRSNQSAVTHQFGNRGGAIIRNPVSGAVREQMGIGSALTGPGLTRHRVTIGNAAVNRNLGAALRPQLDANSMADLRRRIGNGDLNAADLRVSDRGNLADLPLAGRQELSPSNASFPGIGNGVPSSPFPGTNQPSLDDINTRIPGIGGGTPIDGTGTAAEEAEPVDGGAADDTPPAGENTPPDGNTPPNDETPPDADTPDADPEQPPCKDAHRCFSDVISIIGSLGYVSGSFPYCGVGGPGFVAPSEAVQVQSAAADVVMASDGAVVAGEVSESDIELTNVWLVEDGNLQRKTGPRFRVSYHNKGAIEVPKFHLTIAVDASMKLTKSAEIVTVEAVGLRPGKSQTIDVRLPVEVLTMATTPSGKGAPFLLLAAVADSNNDLTETNEENNILVVTRDEIKPLEKGSLASH
jgi:hypothetical protein